MNKKSKKTIKNNKNENDVIKKIEIFKIIRQNNTILFDKYK